MDETQRSDLRDEPIWRNCVIQWPFYVVDSSLSTTYSSSSRVLSCWRGGGDMRGVHKVLPPWVLPPLCSLLSAHPSSFPYSLAYIINSGCCSAHWTPLPFTHPKLTKERPSAASRPDFFIQDAPSSGSLSLISRNNPKGRSHRFCRNDVVFFFWRIHRWNFRHFQEVLWIKEEIMKLNFRL